MGDIIAYFSTHGAQYAQLVAEHIGVSALALGVAILIAVPAGIACARWKTFNKIAVSAPSILRIIPSLAVLVICVPILGTGVTSAVIALSFLAIPPILVNTAVPIYQTATFELGDYDRCVRLFDYSEEGHSYVRFSNPTNTVLERRITSLEGGQAAVSFASGMAAISGTFFDLANAGDEFVAARTLYGGSTSLLEHIPPDYGVTCNFVEDEDDIESYECAITPKTKAVYVECLGNPGMNIVDLEAIGEVAHAHGIPVAIDNTFATPYLFRPFEHGADIVVYSATKYLAGHGTTIAGLVVEKGGFNWLNGNFPQFDYMVNVGDARSLAVHPASSTHFGLPVEEQQKAGVFENTIRFSVGIEDAEDLIHDLDQALSYV